MLSRLYTILLLLLPILQFNFADITPATTVPIGISYQGFLTINGIPFSGTTNFDFELRSGASTVWITNSVMIMVFEGTYNHTMMVPQNKLYPSSNYYIRVYAGGQQLSPDLDLISVPYASYAQHVHWSNIQGMPQDFRDNNDDTSSIWLKSGVNYYMTNDGNVGIGITAPTYKLHVNGSFYADTVNTGVGDNELYAMNQNIQTTDSVTFATINTGQGANELYEMNQNVKTTDSVTFANIIANGNITTTGTVDGYDISSYGPYFISSSGTAGQVWKSDGSGAGNWNTDLQRSEVTVESYIANDISTGYVPYDNGSKLANSTIYNSTSGVGIGTTSTSYKLNVQGNAIFADDIYLRDGSVSTGDTLVRIYDSSDDGIIDIYRNNLVVNRISGNGNSYFTGGNFGINDTTPSYNLDVNGTVAATSYRFRTAISRNYNVSGAAFHSINPGNYISQRDRNGAYIRPGAGTSGLDATFVAPIILPHGVSVKEIHVYVTDNDTTYKFIDWQIICKRYSDGTAFNFASSSADSTTTGYQDLSQTGLSLTINNNLYIYHIWVTCNTRGTSNLRIHGVRIVYTLTTL